MKGPVMLIDGHGLAFRAFYALPELTASDGTPTNALVGFFNMLIKLKREWTPGSISVVFDSPGPTFRHEAFAEYKDGRKPTPEEFKTQLPILKEMLSLLGIPVLCGEGVEADDVIGAMAVRISEAGNRALVVTSDKDMLQILKEGITVIRPGKGISSFNSWSRETFLDEYGFPPERMADYLALVGDSVDNVPGVPGIGDKTARRLLVSYGSLEGILEHLDDLNVSQRKKLEGNAELAKKSLFLTTLRLDAVAHEEEGRRDERAFLSICRDMGMRALEKSLPDLIGEDRWETWDLSEDMSPEVAVEVPLESLLDSELAVHCHWNGIYPMDLKPEVVVVCGENGAFWVGSEFPESLVNRIRKGPVVTSDYKRLYAFVGAPADSSRVWDLRSVDYVLHPDRSSHRISDILGNLTPGSIIEQTASLWEIKRSTAHDLRSGNLERVLIDIDLPLVPVLVEMERRGLGIDKKSMSGVIEDLELRLSKIAAEIGSAAGESINLNSPKQVGELLFERLNLPPVKKTKTGYSTDVTVLEQLADLPVPESLIPRLLLEHRELSKMLSGFAVPLLKSGDGGVIHSTFESDSTGTGRLSSRDPNLQNLPVYGEWSERICRSLVPKKKGRCFVAADYSQIELRVLAHISGESRLVEIFEDGRDIHTETAAMVFGVHPSLVTKELRRSAKMVAFGLLYGMSPFGLARRLGVGQSEAKGIMDRYFKELPGVEAYITRSSEEAIRRGYTETLFGRIRPLNEVETGNSRDNGHLRRVAINSPIQGTAADLAKKAMIAVDRVLDGSGEMVLQVHDSIVCECDDGDSEETLRVLQDAMESVAALSVPLVTDGKIGKTLAEV